MKSIFSKLSAKRTELSAAWDNLSPTNKALCKATVTGALLMTPNLAFAATGSGNQFFCFIANYIKGIVGGAALVVILLWALENFFGMAKIHDLVIKVGITAAIVVAAALIVANSGLVPPDCTTSITG